MAHTFALKIYELRPTHTHKYYQTMVRAFTVKTTELSTYSYNNGPQSIICMVPYFQHRPSYCMCTEQKMSTNEQSSSHPKTIYSDKSDVNLDQFVGATQSLWHDSRISLKTLSSGLWMSNPDLLKELFGRFGTIPLRCPKQEKES